MGFNILDNVAKLNDEAIKDVSSFSYVSGKKEVLLRTKLRI